MTTKVQKRKRTDNSKLGGFGRRTKRKATIDDLLPSVEFDDDLSSDNSSDLSELLDDPDYRAWETRLEEYQSSPDYGYKDTVQSRPFVPPRVTRIPSFSDTEEEREYKAKVQQFYDEAGIDVKVDDPIVGEFESDIIAREGEKNFEGKAASPEDSSDDDLPKFTPDTTPLARFNFKELLDITGHTLNYVIKTRGADIDPTDIDAVRETLDADDEVYDEAEWYTPLEKAREQAEEIVKQIFDMPVRDFMGLAHNVVRFKEELDERGIYILD
ncbi:uncharacterized protein F4822DRAFT_411320 [Hypoxylon trugodes]|uniref:uncharacterized protein n=1 Tax=Hypoxylon trugodes TaxID=326681 RepID=UPI0021963F82|nr:uncharacterized protein F4822DRAFT_411320 [Hypoxylon trugodes]KAI1386819.1 hypothetical protein F4822DRAFT_411320 [Hypoxylon trugodes]